MAAVTIYSDFGAPQIKSVTVSIVSPSTCYEVMGLDAMILVLWHRSIHLHFSPANRESADKTRSATRRSLQI